MALFKTVVEKIQRCVYLFDINFDREQACFQWNRSFEQIER